MRSVYITEHGNLDVLTYGNLPEPVVGPGDIKVRIRACSLNRLDIFIRAGLRGMRMALDTPHILGGDIAGDVAEIGQDVTLVHKNDRVVLNPQLTCKKCRQCILGREECCVKPRRLGSTLNGGYAEFVTVPAANAILIPDQVSYEDAACLPTVFMPGWNFLYRRARLKPWESVLILSASSGIGSAAIQLSKNVIGANVITTTSTKEKVKKAILLGADEVINYQIENVEERVADITNGHGVDVIFDHVGAGTWDMTSASLSAGGRHGIVGVTDGYQAELQLGTLFLKNQTIMGIMMGRREDLVSIVEMAKTGLISGVLHKTFELQDAKEAHQMMETGDYFGKLVLKIS